MVLQMRGTIAPGQKWDVMVDLFFYREPEEAKQQEEEEAVAAPDYGLPAADFGMSALGTDQWPSQMGDQWSADVVQPPISGVPAINWGDQVAVSADVWDPASAPPQIPGPGIDVSAPAPTGWDFVETRYSKEGGQGEGQGGAMKADSPIKAESLNKNKMIG
ncbi:hypothetical protein Gorai_008015 [Gossypium raimondii]|uniref:40S ribosomal protein SA C-terminal domain-containing protein n=1 Tax=Gossypium raimondii TaxID=29730 RepID=A0A7J8QAV0_GOSRA|nr:hypothetical protein [Gossypium raimondii]